MNELWGAVVEKWKAAGVKWFGDFNVAGQAVDGFAHYHIFEVKDVMTVRQMGLDISRGELDKYVARFSFTIGWGYPGLDEFWKSS
jgi:hypothetical protein